MEMCLTFHRLMCFPCVWKHWDSHKNKRNQSSHKGRRRDILDSKAILFTNTTQLLLETRIGIKQVFREWRSLVCELQVTQGNTLVSSQLEKDRGELGVFFSNAIYPPPPIFQPTHPSFALCPAALSRLCSHHNEPGADGALLCLADSDRQALLANSLPGNQLTGLDSARCFFFFIIFSSPAEGGVGDGDRAGEQRGD